MEFIRALDIDHLDAIPRMPSWVTSACAESLEDAAFLSGAALNHLHVLVGLLHCIGEAGLGRCRFPVSCVAKQLADEFHLPSNAWLLVMDVAAFDSSDRLNPAQGRFG